MILTAAFAHLLDPDHDWSWTWDMHGNLAGHIPHEERTRMLAENHMRIKAESRLLTQCEPAKRSMEMLMDTLAQMGGDGKMSLPLNLTIISGASRSGGTYMLKQIGEQIGVDVMRGNAYFYHDYDPAFTRNWFTSDAHAGPISVYLATCMVHTAVTGKPAMKRTVLGSNLIPFIGQLRDVCDVHVRWVHMVRDFPSAYRSLKVMYGDSKPAIERRQHEAYIGRPLHNELPILAIRSWRIANCLPRVDWVKPDVVLFENAQWYAESDEPFHIKPKAEIEDKYLSTYHAALDELSAEYSAAGLPDYFKEMKR